MWFITGCSIGFGREFARAVLARGWRCVATARNQAALDDLAPEAGERLLKVALDVTDPAQIAAAVAQAREHFGAIDVLVNNAGYGYQSSIEEGEEQQIRAQFDANVFGLFALTRAVLPVMREQKRGHVINITSVAGLAGFPGSGYYAASKSGVDGGGGGHVHQSTRPLAVFDPFATSAKCKHMSATASPRDAGVPRMVVSTCTQCKTLARSKVAKPNMPASGIVAAGPINNHNHEHSYSWLGNFRVCPYRYYQRRLNVLLKLQEPQPDCRCGLGNTPASRRISRCAAHLHGSHGCHLHR
ncbi:SDR family NAD(P)-dependent oxidoreductase [Paraburkholderia sp.]|uniref:SDR family NAD(P)-dependent oxidoreductase n=1 Tax=Paraburkholderia sp. TaxID=1926495 RepID=UPI00286F7FFC|nr:SDR family NAD(P)-dependent oxidoreductase [Paraburkholderia sp.]